MNNHTFKNTSSHVFAMLIFFLTAVHLDLHAQSDFFGRSKVVKSPGGYSSNTAMPSLLNNETQSSSNGDERQTSESLTTREQAAPTFLRGSISNRSGFSMMHGTGYGFSNLFGLGFAPRVGYVTENGFYFGFMLQINFGSTLLNPRNGGLGINSPVIDAASQLASVELGFETPIKLFGLLFYNRPYFSIGAASVNFAANSNDPSQFLSRRFANQQTFPQAGINLFGATGNLFYFTFKEIFMIKGLMIGADARYFFLNNANTFGVFFTTGIRLF